MLRRVVRVELKVFFSVCGFPVDPSFYSSIGIPGCDGVQKCNGSVFFLGGWGAEIKALSLTCSITKFAKTALTGKPIGQPNICL